MLVCLGYVAGLETNELCSLERLMDGDYTVEERMMLEVSFYQNGKKQTYQVLNDAIVARGSLSRILDLTVSYQHETVCQYRADGLIVSTPTGSTCLFLFSRRSCYGSHNGNGILLTPYVPIPYLDVRLYLVRIRSCLYLQRLSTTAI